MIRIVIGSIIAGLIQFVIGAIAWATPLSRFAFTSLGQSETAEVQAALARTLTPTGTGTYFIPSPETAEGTVLLGKGPVALIHFNTSGFPVMEPSALLTGLIASIVMMLLVGVALSQLDSFASRMRTMLLFAAATILYFILTLPVYNIYMPWNWWIFLGVEEFIAFTLGAAVMIRWFMPRAAAAPAAAPETPLP